MNRYAHTGLGYGPAWPSALPLWYPPARIHLIVGFSRPVAEQATVASLSNSMHCCGRGGGVNLSFSDLVCGGKGRMGRMEPVKSMHRDQALLPSPHQTSSPSDPTTPSSSSNSSPSTWTRACASMLPAGVLLTQRYHVPSYTSTLLIRNVPFLETSNLESCSKGEVLALPAPHWGESQAAGSNAREDQEGCPRMAFLTSEMGIWFLYHMMVGLGVACVRQCR